MLFPTIQFALFFVVVLTVAWLLAPFPRRWKLFLLGASYLFYAAWDHRFVALLAASTVLNEVAAVALQRCHHGGRRRWILGAAIAANLGILGYFKYYGFLVSSTAAALRPLGIDVPVPLLQIVLPVGISFFTFQALSYVIDVYRRALAPSGLLDFAVYLAFFPHLVAGPIVRASEFLPQLRARPDPRAVDGGRAFALIVVGLFKKVVVASFLAASIVDPVFAAPRQHSAAEILVATYAYAVQIYADLSGYTDIAIGSALLLGVRFPENFDAPYTARSLQDFWRRWHMTLSRWLRDYLYIPLGGSQGTPRTTVRNIMLTMVLGGLWHGAAWTFVVWGAIHGVGLALEHRAAPTPEENAAARWRLATQRLVTFHIVCLAWVFFRAESLGAAGTLLARLLTAWGPAPRVTPQVAAVVVLALAAQYLPRQVTVRLEAGFSRLRPLPMGVGLGLALLVIDTLGPQGVAPFIYFQF